MGITAKFICLIFFSLLLTSHIWAYQEIEVTNGGVIKGRAILSGKMPENRIFHLILFPNLDMCAEVDTDDNLNRVLFDFKIGSEKGLKVVKSRLSWSG